MPKTKLNRKFLETLAADPSLKKAARDSEAKKAKEVIRQVSKERSGQPKAKVLAALQTQFERAGLTPDKRALDTVAAAIHDGILKT